MEQNSQRRIGKTTRLVDEAVQALFTDGAILIPHKVDGYNDWISDCKIDYYGKIKCFIDEPNFSNQRIQEEFFKRLKRRLDLEHPDSYSVVKNYCPGGKLVRVSN